MPSSRARSAVSVASLAGALVVTGLALAPSAQAAPTDPVTFSYTGATQAYVVPDGITMVTVTVTGASGIGSAFGSAGGPGRTVTADLPVTAGDTLRVEVGGDGTRRAGGYNGGGDGGDHGAFAGDVGGGGGGASDIRTSASLDSRLVVAGGGGGGGVNNGGAADASAPNSRFFACGGQAGTLDAGGAGGGAGNQGAPGGAGSYGLGGPGGNGIGGGTPGGGGGGGGYYGGGGGGAGGAGCGGGGGSSYVTADATNVSYGYAGTASVVIAPIVYSGPDITTQPADAAALVGDTVTFTAVATGNPAPGVQWQVSTDGGDNWNDVTGATTTTLTVANVTTGQDGNRYRAVFASTYDGSDHTATSNAATLSVGSVPVVTTQPEDVSVVAGASASFTAAATGSPAPTVTWQSAAGPDAAWADIAGATGTTYTVDQTTAAMDGTRYRAVFANNAGGQARSVPTDAATLTVLVAPAFNPGTAPPTTADVGSDYDYTFDATGNPAPTFAVASGTLPPGLTLDPATGKLSGKPTTPGDYTFTISAANGVGTAAVTDPITISVRPALEIVTRTLPDGQVGISYRALLTATGGDGGEYVWSLAPGSALPRGLALSADGVITGVPEIAGTTTFTVSVNDPVTAELSITIVPASAPAPGPAPAPEPATSSAAPITGPSDSLASTGPALDPLRFTELALAVMACGTALLGAGRRRPRRRRR